LVRSEQRCQHRPQLLVLGRTDRDGADRVETLRNAQEARRDSGRRSSCGMLTPLSVEQSVASRHTVARLKPGTALIRGRAERQATWTRPSPVRPRGWTGSPRPSRTRQTSVSSWPSSGRPTPALASHASAASESPRPGRRRRCQARSRPRLLRRPGPNARGRPGRGEGR
jgi:hypothetical protein